MDRDRNRQHASAPPAAPSLDEAIARLDIDAAHRFIDAGLADHTADRARLLFTRAALWMQEGFVHEACQTLRELVLRQPARREFWSTYLTALKPADIAPEAFALAHRAYGARFPGDAALSRPQFPRSEHRLHVGYLGGDGHEAIPRFLSHLWHSRHDVTLYVRNRDSAAQYAGLRCVVLPSGRGAATEALRREHLDVLVDLCCHGPGGMLDVLAARPAPVMLTWLDYLATSGTDYFTARITDWIADPPGNERFHAEPLARLPFAAWCYTPWKHAPAPRVADNDRPVLGSACIPLKFNDRTLALWRRVMESMPDARLDLMGFVSHAARRRVIEALGPAVAARTRLYPRLAMRDYLDVINGLDVALDTLGFSGGTSTLDALWQDVPVVTLPGRLSHARSAASLALHLGRGEFVARDEADYVRKVAALVRSRASRAALRERLRESTLCRPERFAGGFDRLLDGLFHGHAACELDTAFEAALARPADRRLRRDALRRLGESAA